MSQTYRMWANLEFQHTFADGDLEQDPDRAPGDLTPTDAAMQALIVGLDAALRDTIRAVRIELDLDGKLEQAIGRS